jgi:hypothetical protein
MAVDEWAMVDENDDVTGDLGAKRVKVKVQWFSGTCF